MGITFTPEQIEAAAARHWNLTANIQWHEPAMQEAWKRDGIARMAYALTGLQGELAASHHPNRAAVTIETVARIAHEVNRAYCAALGDESQPAWNDAPDWQRQSALNGVRFHLDNPNADASASHENWFKEKAAAGWVFGLVKDPVAKTHPCCVPFTNLPRSQQAKDHIFRAIVHALVGQNGGTVTDAEADPSFREFGTVILHLGSEEQRIDSTGDAAEEAKASLLQAFFEQLLEHGVVKVRQHGKTEDGRKRFSVSTEVVLWGAPESIRSDILPHAKWWKAVRS